jgi:hypothetical protein
MTFASATLAAAGTPQRVSASTSPTLPTIKMGGVSFPAGSVTSRARRLLVQADPSNTGANIYIGGAKMVAATRVNVGLVLAKTAAPVSLGDYEGFSLDEVYFDGDTTGDKLLLVWV